MTDFQIDIIVISEKKSRLTDFAWPNYQKFKLSCRIKISGVGKFEMLI